MNDHGRGRQLAEILGADETRHVTVPAGEQESGERFVSLWDPYEDALFESEQAHSRADRVEAESKKLHSQLADVMKERNELRNALESVVKGARQRGGGCRICGLIWSSSREHEDNCPVLTARRALEQK